MLTSSEAQTVYKSMLKISNDPSIINGNEANIVLIQVVLENLCYNVDITGEYDLQTVGAITQMQKDAGFSALGDITKKTVYTLYDAIRQAIINHAGNDKLKKWAIAKMKQLRGQKVDFVEAVVGDKKKEISEEGPSFNWKEYAPYLILLGIGALVGLSFKEKE